MSVFADRQANIRNIARENEIRRVLDARRKTLLGVARITAVVALVAVAVIYGTLN